MKIQILCILLFLLIFIPHHIFTIEEISLREAAADPPNQNTSDALVIETLGSVVTPQIMMEKLIGENNLSVQISNVSYTGANIASGIFDGARDEGLAIDSGVILSSGFATNVYGPNVSQGITGSNGVAGSANLNNLIPGYSTNDASVFEFDFIPKFNSIGFTYVFGSDEYLEWVGSSFNDVFGLFIDYENIAIIPGTDVPVSINNVNPNSYSDFYTDNPPGSNNFNIEPDGMTVAVSVSRLIEPDVQHHISFEVADAGDFILDSWVFLEAGSFASVQCSTYFNVIVEDGLEQEMYEDEELEINVIAIGEDAAHFGWTIHPPSHGTAVFITNDLIEEERTILYTPDEDYNGIDAFVLSVTDGLGGLINRFIEITVLPVKDAPVCTSSPVISGDFYLNGIVYCYPGEWNDDIDNQYAQGFVSTINFFYQWQRSLHGIMDWNDIEGATDSNYMIVEEEVGHYIRCVVTAVDDGIGVGDDDTTIEESNIEYCANQVGTEDIILTNGFIGVYPNPFNPTTTIYYNVSDINSDVSLEIYNIKGQQVTTLVNGIHDSGRFTAVWNGKDTTGKLCPTGFYLANLKINEQQFVRKMLLLK
jgi:hypothetical protein